MYRLWNENNVKSSKVVSLRQNKSHSPLNLEKLKIITYNTNGLRAAVGKGLPEWLAQEQPDVLCIQETKLQPDQFPSETFETLGYKSYLFSAQKKGYSGVAILTKQEPDHIEYGMGIEKYEKAYHLSKTGDGACGSHSACGCLLCSCPSGHGIPRLH